jgi:UV DNA damage endonuclease
VINYGLCCISLVLSEKGEKFQTLTYTRFKALGREEGMKVLSNRILNNFNVTLKTISHCAQSGIGSYRLSSEITPLLSHPDLDIDLTKLDHANR